MDEPAAGSGPDTPNPARVWAHLLTGKGGFPPDRDQAARLASACPGITTLTRINRTFILKSVTWLAAKGIRQFIDAGCGGPFTPSVAATARAACPDARIAYVDRDPLVISHITCMEARPDDIPGVRAVLGDIRYPETILDSAALRSVISLDKPVGVLFGAVLCAMSAAEARSTVTGFTRPLVPGSAVVISGPVITSPGVAGRVSAVSGWFTPHSLAAVRSFFTAPGLMPVHRAGDVSGWPMAPGEDQPVMIAGGVGFKTYRDTSRGARVSAGSGASAGSVLRPGAFSRTRPVPRRAGGHH